MLYKKNKTERLSEELFRDPTAEYRGTPFWSWNGALEEEECVRQAHIFREMGLGGYHMHPRAGLATPYLGEKFMSCVKACAEDAKKSDMLCWLYDEDKYPSGFGGGFVTKDGRFRRRGLFFTPFKRKETAVYKDGRQCGGTKLLATYAVRLCFGKMLSYKRLSEGEKACGKRFYAYLVVDEPTDNFNQAGYVDVLCKEALDAFAEITYGAYEKCVGEDFGKSIPAIFTDEPQMKMVDSFRTPLFPIKSIIPWTDDFAAGYEATYGADVLDTLPEIFFDGKSATTALSRWRYHSYRTERFAEAFSDNLGKRAEALGIHLTGHLMEEPTLTTQFRAVGETMRHYKNFGLPGIDMLCGRHEYSTAKQTQSVVRQEGKEGMLCELYGVSRWALEFGKFKEEGDWLACLGVTVRVPHLSYYTMKGEAKRDYPPSISYQAPWYKEYKQVEDHFSRLNTALSRGKALSEVAVIHPIESFYLEGLSRHRKCKAWAAKDRAFLSLIDWLLFDGIDFDFISEALLPSQRREDPLAVGECRYKTILVPPLGTMRRTTLDYLKAFKAAGGKVVFLGGAPMLVDGVRAGEVAEFAQSCDLLPFAKEEVLSAVKDNAMFSVKSAKRPGEYLATLREDGEGEWLFLTAPRAGYPYPHSVPLKNDPKVIEDEVTVSVKGEWYATEYDTITGEIRPIFSEQKEGVTYLRKRLYNNDSLLLRLEKAGEQAVPEAIAPAFKKGVPFAESAEYTLGEPNVVLLDKAKWSVGGRYHKRLDLDLLTKKARKALGLPPYRPTLQPWLRAPEEGDKPNLCLRFEFDSEVALPAHLACEHEEFALSVNGEKVAVSADGYYVDKAIRTYPIEIKKGRNVIDLTIPLGMYECAENCYLLGEFAVKMTGTKARLVPLPETLAFGDVKKQGFPFYGGKLTYRTTFESNGENAQISAHFASALLKVSVNGENKDVLYAPYAATFPTKQGKNEVELTVYVPRENAFGAVHIRRRYKYSDSPSWYRRTGLPWRVRAYVLDEGGILEPPTLLLK